MRSWFGAVRGSLPGRVVDAYFTSSVQSYAAGLAFNAFVTLFPLVLGVLAVVGYFARSRPVEAEVVRAILAAVPTDFHASVQGTLRSVSRNAGAFGLASVVGLVWAGTGLFASLEFALNRVYGAPARSFLARRLTGLRLIGVFVMAVVASVFLNTAISFAADPDLTFVVGFLGGWALMAVMLCWIYVAAPNRVVRLGEAWPGAVVAGLLVEVVSLAFPLFSSVTHRTNLYGRGLALAFLFLTWLYVLSQVLLLGAVLNRVLFGSEGGVGVGGGVGRGRVVPELEEPASLVVPEDADGSGVEGELGSLGQP